MVPALARVRASLSPRKPIYTPASAPKVGYAIVALMEYWRVDAAELEWIA